jgi:hypothetical protein
MKFINYIEAKVPTWAMSYLVNNDATGITDEDKQQVDQWVEQTRAALKEASPGAWYEFIDSCQESGSFTHRPAFGLACDTVDGAIVAIVNDDDPREAMQLPWAGGDEE